MKLTKNENESFSQCKGWCSKCVLDGGCDLQKKLDKMIDGEIHRDKEES